MSQKQETVFSKNLNQYVVSEGIFVQKNNNQWHRGIPDFYIEGQNGRIMWREDKFILKPWIVAKLPEEICKTVSWVHQREWLTRAHNNGVLTRVVIGAPKLACVLEYPYEFDPERHEFISRKAAAAVLNSLILS